MSTEVDIRKKVREAPGNVASGFLQNKAFTSELNRYMFMMHIRWGAYLACFIVGITYLVSALQVPPLISGSVAVTVGAIGISWEAISNFRKTARPQL